MILSDATIREQMKDGYIRITPEPSDRRFQPASVDLTLGNEFQSPYDDSEATIHYRSYVILPGECVLATTAEWVELSSNIAARVEGKSSIGRKFLLVHATAGFVDPNFSGNITLELVNLSKVSQQLTIGMPIAQINFTFCDKPVLRPYGHPDLGNHYQGQEGVTPSVLPWT